jgi:hydroxymethylpyrimidine pyrophosphatase-like HAD family hydrolase
MNMFATDLDRTLIYSNRALEELGLPDKIQLSAAEMKDGQPAAYMTTRSLSLLRELAGEALVVPVTTRTYEQYKRVGIFGKDIPISYAVTSNGAQIFHEGKPLQEWAELVYKRLKEECANLKEIADFAEGFRFPGVFKKAGESFFYYILQERISLEEKKKLDEDVRRLGWRISLQGRKLYFMPIPVCKGEAVKFISQREGAEKLAGAGDSILDYDFLKVCQHAFVPDHGELSLEAPQDFSFRLSENRGILAGEEILSWACRLLLGREAPVNGSPAPGQAALL